MKNKMFNCYIEEYFDDKGCLCARIRDKASNKRVEVTHKNFGVADKLHFLNFLNQAKRDIQIMPSIYSRDGSDAIVVSGNVEKETDDFIRVDIMVESGGYWYA